MNSLSRDFIYKHLHELVSDGIQTMKDHGLSEVSYTNWVKYSEKILEITTKEYNPSILMNYLRVIATIEPNMPPYQKIGKCLDYLIRVMQMI